MGGIDAGMQLCSYERESVKSDQELETDQE